MRLRCESRSNSPEATIFRGRIGIVIPAFNEAAHLPELIERCCALEPALIVIVDDASTDNTAAVLARAQRAYPGKHRIIVLGNRNNLGKQGAVKRALQRLTPETLDGVAIIDGDLQHDPGELPGLSCLLEQYDAVIGARSHEEMPRLRRVSNALVNWGFRLISGIDFVDVQSGLRLYRKPVADALAERLRYRGGFGLEHESLTAMARYSCECEQGLRVVAAPITCAYGDEQSHIGLRDMLRLAFETFRQAQRLRRAARRRVIAGFPS